MQLKQLKSRPDCTMCELHEEATNVGVPTVWWDKSLPPTGESPVLMVLGMNPGCQEDKNNEPFIGPSGQLLKGPYLTGSGLDKLASIFFLNSARCWTPATAPPKRRHYKACIEHTLVDANHIMRLAGNQKVSWLCCGAAAVSTLTRTLFDKHLSLTESFRSQSRTCSLVGRDAEGADTNTTHDCNLFATYHPAAVLRNPNLIHAVQDHLALLTSYLKGELPRPTRPTVVPPRTPNKKGTQADGCDQGILFC